MATPYDALKIANWFITRALRDQRVLSVMMVLKLCYIAHGWHLESRGGPLFWNRIEAWRYGPVIRDVYVAFQSQGLEVAELAPGQGDGVDSEVEELLEEVYRIYGSLPAFWLSELTHVIGGPWDITTKARGFFAEIPDTLIKQHYVMKRANAEEQANHA